LTWKDVVEYVQNMASLTRRVDGTFPSGSTFWHNSETRRPLEDKWSLIQMPKNRGFSHRDQETGFVDELSKFRGTSCIHAQWDYN